jgi:hypothetical protein
MEMAVSALNKPSSCPSSFFFLHAVLCLLHLQNFFKAGLRFDSAKFASETPAFLWSSTALAEKNHSFQQITPQN